ncbi:MAG TPA: TMEM175 family protein [Anaerolineales bacterium]|nr:TMEM175 family protein [Anaerolineales bacterium]
MEKSRLEAFSDGVFAIVITLLILDIRFPDVAYSQFKTTLVSLLPRILAYMMSFIIIGLYWVVHHTSMHAIRKTDRVFLWLNILLLLFVSFIPFPTSLLGRYPFQAWPIIIYGFTLIASNVVGYIMLVYVWYHPHLAIPDFNIKYMRRHTPVYIFVNGSYLGAILLAHSLPLLSYLIYIVVIVALIVFLPKLDDGINR